MKKSFSFLLIAVAISLTFVTCTELPDHVKDRFQGGILPQSLTFLGTVEGKSYFADNTTNITWFQAKEYCESMRMNLASIETPGQAEFLNDIDEYFDKSFWLSGRDLMTPQQFTWGKENKSIDESFLPEFYILDGIQKCLFYYFTSIGTSAIQARLCAKTFGNLGSLCEA